jgi:hypothetical protein
VIEAFMAAVQGDPAAPGTPAAAQNASGAAIQWLPLPAITAQHSTPKIRDGQLLPDAHYDGFYYALLQKR